MSIDEAIAAFNILQSNACEVSDDAEAVEVSNQLVAFTIGHGELILAALRVVKTSGPVVRPVVIDGKTCGWVWVCRSCERDAYLASKIRHKKDCAWQKFQELNNG